MNRRTFFGLIVGATAAPSCELKKPVSETPTVEDISVDELNALLADLVADLDASRRDLPLPRLLAAAMKDALRQA